MTSLPAYPLLHVPLFRSPPLRPAAVLGSLCDVWRCKSANEAKARLRRHLASPFPTNPDPSIVGVQGTGSRGDPIAQFAGFVVDASLPPLPPSVTSPPLNEFALREAFALGGGVVGTGTGGRSRHHHLGLVVLDFMTPELAARLLRLNSTCAQ